MPPKGKKGKKGGDKLLKSEFQMLKDEEGRRRYLQDIKDKAKEKQGLEEKNAHINNLKIQNRWREIMKAGKARELLQQIEILKQVHERHLDRKSAGVENLARDVDEAESQYSTALQAHCMNIDTLIDLQASRLQTLQNQFESDLGILETEFNTERMKVQTAHAKERADILGIMGRMEQDFQDAEADARHEYSSLRDDVKNKNLEEKHALRIQLEGTVEDLWRQFQAALNQYNASTEERKKQFEELKSKDSKNAKEIEQQMRKLVKLQETIAHIKSRLSSNSKEYEERNRALRQEKDAIQSHFQSLKRRMNTFRDRERRKLTELTIVSNKAIKDLKAKVGKAEKIIRMAEMNRKLETEEEKVLPFYKESPTEQKDVQLATQELIESATSVPLPKEFAAMEQFHKRYNKVSLDRLALEKQRAKLQEENLHLRGILKQYLDGISVNEVILDSPNPLVVVNGRTNAPLRHPQSHLNITYVEAAHEAAHHRQSIAL
ncbi:Dynein regulatory complex subunit 2 [Geranomyces variabilis]|uniref:Dynein regulatory complex subunit 2 n=1 Tax=Geranomyces variabilis TaxID=109894 RepID=A0AAD5XQJ6_9FUNG|nr:Dynein regulatory complex subunit 2 [Geranomyces variabilis]